MVKFKDIEPYEWIRNGVINVEHEVEGSYVRNWIPEVFEAYCKILHPIYEDSSIKDKTLTWDEWDKDQNGLPRRVEPGSVEEILNQADSNIALHEQLHRLEEVSMLPRGGTGDIEGSIGRRVFWKELAERYGLIFHPEIHEESFTRKFRQVLSKWSWPRYLAGPDEGTLNEEMCLEIARLLQPYIGNQECYFYYFMQTEKLEELVWRWKFSDPFPDSLAQEVSLSPTYWWPSDHTWCLNTDYDSAFSVLGSSRSMIDSFLENPIIECVETDSTHRLDAYSDRING